jgi:hypothetical protein
LRLLLRTGELLIIAKVPNKNAMRLGIQEDTLFGWSAVDCRAFALSPRLPETTWPRHRTAAPLAEDPGWLQALQPPLSLEGDADPKALAPKLLERRLRSESVETAWALTDEGAVLEEGERLGNKATRERLIPALRAEQVALRRIAADPDLPVEVRDHATELDEEALYRMQRLLLEARRRERTPEGKKALVQAERELLADAG